MRGNDLSLAEYFQRRPIQLITDGGKLRNSGQLLVTLEKLIKLDCEKLGGIHLREQSDPNSEATMREIETIALELKKLSTNKLRLILNRNAEIALSLGLDGVHLGGGQLDQITLTRKILDRRPEVVGFSVSYSAHSVEEALEAERLGADYTYLSPIFAPHSKSDLRTTLGTAAISELYREASKPIVALGGISSSNAKECLSAGASGIALIGAVMQSEDPCRSLLDLAATLD